MKNFYIVLNDSKEGVLQYADNLDIILKDKGINTSRSIGYIDKNKLPENIDCIITLGGDGTLMRVARDIAGLNIPILGINMGHLGYLTSVKKEDDVENIIDRLLSLDFTIEKRMMLKGYAIKKGVQTKKYLALNEIVINRILTGKTIQCKINVNDEYLNSYNSDGIIISTPTGSTAYNLSAGGPLAEPKARMMIVTPICPHSLNLRSIVLGGDSIVDIEIIGEETGERIAIFDGENTIKLDKGDHVIISESKVKVHFIKLNGTAFMDNLRNKMRGL